jgi:hypothetical protein
MNQSDLDLYCNKLHGMIEAPMDPYVDPENLDRAPFFHFKGEIKTISSAIANYYKGLVGSIKTAQEKKN